MLQSQLENAFIILQTVAPISETLEYMYMSIIYIVILHPYTSCSELLMKY